MTQQINLYDPRLRRKRELLSAQTIALLSVVLLLLVGVAGTWSRSAAQKAAADAALLAPQAKALQDQLPLLGQQRASRKPDALLEQQLAMLKAQVDSRVGILALLKQGLGPDAVSFAEYLRGFARQTPNGLWLTGFAVDGDGGGMEIKGRTVDPALIAEYIKRLKAEKAFHGRAFSALQVSVPVPAAGTNVVSAVAVAGTTSLPIRPPYHEFTLVPDKLPRTTSTSMADQNQAGPSGLQSAISTIAPEAAHALSAAPVAAGQR
jgi:type IV pilus assembly PilN-like protein